METIERNMCSQEREILREVGGGVESGGWRARDACDMHESRRTICGEEGPPLH